MKDERAQLICSKCIWHINGRCRYPELCCNFNKFKQDISTYIRPIQTEIKTLKKEIEKLNIAIKDMHKD